VYDGFGQKAKIDALVMNRPTLSDRYHDVIVNLKYVCSASTAANNDRQSRRDGIIIAKIKKRNENPEGVTL
jgi:hypothetical protein